MTTEYESNCAYCSGRDTHCFEYITESADGLIHVGEPCLISKLRTRLDLKRECKRLGLNSPEECYNRHSKIGKLIPRGSSPLDNHSPDSVNREEQEVSNNTLTDLDINSLLERIKYIPVEEIHRAELGLLEDCFIEEEIW